MDLAQFAGEDYADVEIDGTVYRVGELTLREWAPVQAWIKANVPGPLSVLGSPDFAALPPPIKREVLGEAMDRDRLSWPPPIGRKNWFLSLDHPASTREGMPFDSTWDKPSGHAVALKAILGKNRPGITIDECQAIADGATFEQILPAFAAALGMFGPKSLAPPPPAKEKGPKKKAATGPTTSKTSPSSSSRRPAGRRATSSA